MGLTGVLGCGLLDLRTGGGTRARAELGRVTELPDHLDRAVHVDLHGRNVEPWFRRIGLVLLLATCALGLANFFGQHTHVVSADSAAAKLTVESPGAARGGLIYQSIFRVDAHRSLAAPTLLLAPGWFDGLTINTVEPDAVEWGQDQGRNTLKLPSIAAGDVFILRLQYQVNPTVIGHRSQQVVLKDGGEQILTLPHDQTIFP
jgi:hypothetical protein